MKTTYRTYFDAVFICNLKYKYFLIDLDAIEVTDNKIVLEILVDIL